MGGTHWYHPHHHGSTALHVTGGASGAIIVEDNSSEVPAEIANMSERLLFFTVVHNLVTINTQTYATADTPFTVSSPATTQIFVNGQATGLEVPVTAGEWTRLRLIFSAMDRFKV